MRRMSNLGVVVVALLLLIAPRARAADEKPSLQATAIQLFNSLSADQKAQVLLPYDSPERSAQVFTGGPRKGIPLRDLRDEQRKVALSMLEGFTSDYGADKCRAVADQEPGGLERYYLCFFGEPGEGKTYAWRIAEHHLTLVHIEVDKGEPASFGPILLGANPPVLWNDEEDALIALYASLTPEEKQKVTGSGKGISSQGLKREMGLKISDLNASAQEKAKAVYQGRLKFFSAPIRKRIEHIADAQGGLAAMRIIFWNAADKRCADGGRWDFKLGGETFLCDYENSRGHIHMSMRGSLSQGR